MCYAASGPGGKHLSFEECRRAIDRLVQAEGRAEVLQLSGGEPTIHPEFLRILEYAVNQPIDYVMINSNGLRFAHDPEFTAAVARYRKRLEVYLQFDGFSDAGSRVLRGEALLEQKLKAVEMLGQHGINTILVTTLQPGVNEQDIGAIVRFGLERRWVTGVSFQPATYSGRHVLPETLEQRLTFPDVIRLAVEQCGGLFRTEDFLPLPCAHPNCHSLAYLYRSAHGAIPLSRFIDARNHLDILANGITFTRPRARALIEQYLGRLGCCGSGGCCGPEEAPPSTVAPLAEQLPVLGSLGDATTLAAAQDFFARALSEQLSTSDVFRVTITSFLDAYNFDVRRLMKCCIHHVLPSGHIIPFCAYNVLYRDGHVPLPPLRKTAAPSAAPARVMSLPVVSG